VVHRLLKGVVPWPLLLLLLLRRLLLLLLLLLLCLLMLLRLLLLRHHCFQRRQQVHQGFQAAQQYHAGSCLGASMEVQHQSIAQQGRLAGRSAAACGVQGGRRCAINVAFASPLEKGQTRLPVPSRTFEKRVWTTCQAVHRKPRLPMMVQAIRSVRPPPVPLRAIAAAAVPRCAASAAIGRAWPLCCLGAAVSCTAARSLCRCQLAAALAPHLPRLRHHLRRQGWVAAKRQRQHPFGAVVRHSACGGEREKGEGDERRAGEVGVRVRSEASFAQQTILLVQLP
jgi:hypothetical protein